MRIVKIILSTLLVLLVIYLITSFFLPSKYNVSRELSINGPSKQIYSQVIDFKKWEQWSPWLQEDPTMTFQYEEQTASEGASYSWTSEESGGKQTIKYASPYDTIKTVIQFDGMDPANGLWTFNSSKDGSTLVSWGFSGELGFFSRVFGLFIDGMVGESFEIGLANIKYIVESQKIEEIQLEVYRSQLDSMRFYSITENVAMTEISSDFFGKNFSQINAYLGKEMQNSKRPPFAIFHEWNEAERRAKIEMAIPLMSMLEGNDKIAKREIATTDALFVDYYGPYEFTGKAHEAIQTYAMENATDLLGMGIEIYVTDPSAERDTSLWLTKVVYPIAK